MSILHSAPARRPPGATAGTALGVLAGCLLVTIWLPNPDVGFAVTVVFAGLVACLLWGAPGWRRFGLGLLAGALVAAGAYVAVLVGAS
jgi:hypothetical protein